MDNLFQDLDDEKAKDQSDHAQEIASLKAINEHQINELKRRIEEVEDSAGVFKSQL